MVRHKNGSNVPFVDDIAIVFAYISKHYNKGISNSFCIQYSEMDSFSMSTFTIS